MLSGERLKAWRTKRWLTQTELAERAGLPQSYIARLESGQRANPSLDALTRIAKALRVPLTALLK